MKPAHFQAYRYYQIIIAVIGLSFLLFGLTKFRQTNPDPGVLLILAVFAGFLVQYPIKLFQGEVNLVPVVTLGCGFIMGPIPAAWASTLGMLTGYILRWFVREKRSWRRFVRLSVWIKLGYGIGMITIPLILILSQFGFSGEISSAVEINRVISKLIFPTTLYLFSISLFFLVGFYLQKQFVSISDVKLDFIYLLWVNLLTIPFIVLVTESYSYLGIRVLVLLGGVPAVSTYLLHTMNAAQIDHERRVRELSTLNYISNKLRSTLDLDELLPVIQQQVMQLLGVENFYVALYDRDTEELWYPFAIKFGKQQQWDRRRMTDRLTDRVIKNGKSLILTPQTQPFVVPGGLLPSEVNPTSWLGVPLISSERTIGCLAVFTLEPGAYFSDADADVLAILSGQVSVAIENALLYQQTQDRARKLETLNHLTVSITASLDLQEVLEQVCNSVAQVVGGQRSAVFLLNTGGDTVSLAYTHGLDESFQENNTSFSIANSRRARCLRTGRPFIVPTMKDSSLSQDLIDLFRADKIQAFADFPMITPEGQIGFLSVYFDQEHHFSLEEVGILQTFASQAALAVANARLHARTDATLARRVNQLTTLEAVGRELSAATHSDRLFTLILEYALEMTNSCCGTVVTYEADTQNMVIKAAQGYVVPETEFPLDRGITGRVARTGKTANVRDVSLDPDFIDLREGDTYSQLSVPIIHENRIMGIITLESLELNAYSESEEAFVTQLANQAAIDIINAELYHETQRRLSEQSTLYQVSARLVSAVTPDHVAQAITQAIDSVLKPRETRIYYWVEENQTYTRLGFPGEHLPVEISEHIYNLHVPQADSGIMPLSTDDSLFVLLSDRDKDQLIFTVPLAMAHQRSGLVVLYLNRDQQINEDETKLLMAILAQGSIALQNAYHFHEATNVRDRLAAVLNSIEEGILMIDVDGQVLLANEPIRILSGFPLEVFLESPLSELPDDILKALGYTQTEIKALLKSFGQLQVPVSPKTVFESRDPQRTHFIERITTPVWSRDSVVIGWMILLRDITEEYEIEQTREAITETVVHDLRSPMSAIVGALDLLSDCLTEEDDSVVKQALLVAQRSANRVLALTEALLDIARFQSGRMQIELENITLPNLVSELLIEFTTLANDDSVIIRSEIPSQLPTIRADRDKLIRVLSNLVDNAIKFTPQGGHITISAEPAPNDQVAIKVKDSGPGVPMDYREKIFERFVQVPGQHSRRRGTGLGLAFCRLTVEAHGGRIWVDSPPDGGSVFTFTLPVDSPIGENTSF